MAELIAGFDTERRGVHLYLRDELRRCVAWTRPATAPADHTEVRLLAWHDIPDAWRTGRTRRAGKGAVYVVPDDEADTLLRQIAATIRTTVAHSPAVTR